MTEYYLHPRLRFFQPERRKSQLTTQAPVARTTDVARTTSEQYAFLRDCLLRREDETAKLGIHERRSRHLLVLATIIFVSLVFATPDFSFRFQLFGFTQKFTLVQIGAVMPLVIAYMILYACFLGATRLRLRHECRVIALELESFGSPTSYTVTKKYFDATCPPEGSFWRRLFAPGPYESIFRTHDLFLLASAVIVLAGTGVVAVDIFKELRASHPRLAWTLTIYMAVSGLAALAAPLVLRWVRFRRRTILAQYEKEVRAARDYLWANERPPQGGGL